MMRAPPLVLVALLGLIPDRAGGCIAVPRDGRVDISSETALIVWDEANRTQHFVRTGSFQSTDYDFGFLVPTPNRPELDVADPKVFGQLAAVTAPKVETRTTHDLNFGCFKMTAKLGAEVDTGGVVVLEQKKVGDYDAAVLAFKGAKGDDPAAGAGELAAWLRDHGYPFTPTLAAWLKPYVENKWVVTAFKIAAPKPDGDPKARTVRQTTQPVRMSFKTDRPVYPYREPAEMRDAEAAKLPRLLRLYFVGPKRFDGKLGGAAWPGQTMWANALTAEERGRLAGSLKLPDGELWLTEFEDRSRPRPGTDEVYFEPAADQSRVARPPDVRVVNDPSPWLVGGAMGLVVAAVAVWRMSRKKA